MIAPQPGRRWLTRRRILTLAAAAAVILLVVYASSSRLLTLAGDALVHEDPLERVDALIVLASGIDRIVEASDLYRGGYAPLVIITKDPPDPTDDFLRSRGVPTETSEEARIRILRALGVPAAAIVVLEPVIHSTIDEGNAFAAWQQGRSLRSLMIVTSPSHSGRSRATFLHVLRDRPIRVLVRPSRLSAFRTDNWWQTRATLREGILEWQKLVYYHLVEFWR